MSIGQCIDFATHVGYRIYRSECKNPDDRIRDSLGAIAWPVLQAGTSTLLGTKLFASFMYSSYNRNDIGALECGTNVRTNVDPRCGNGSLPRSPHPASDYSFFR